MQAWTVPRDTSKQLPEGISTAQEAVVQDCNQNVLFGHVDLFGNPVKVQGLAESAKDTREVFVPVTERPVVTDVGPTPTMDMPRSNPLIQQMVEECMAILEQKMRYATSYEKWYI